METKGKKDFDGTIDGSGYKGSMDDPKKPPLDLIPPTFSRGTARVLGKGLVKYARGQWMRGMSYSGLIAAAQRHLLAVQAGEDVDPESGELHIYHAACELAFLSHFMESPRAAEYARFDDRIFGLKAPLNNAVTTQPLRPQPPLKENPRPDECPHGFNGWCLVCGNVRSYLGLGGIAGSSILDRQLSEARYDGGFINGG